MKKTVTVLGSMALFGVVSLAIANNAPSTSTPESDAVTVTEETAGATETTSAEAAIVSNIASSAMDKAINEGLGTEKEKESIEKSKIIEKAFQAFIDNDYDPAAAVDKAAEVAVEQGWCRSKDDAKRQLRKKIEKARKNENLVNKFYKMLGI